MDRAASPFRTRTVLILIASGLLLMIGFLLVNAYGDRFERQRGNTPSPASRFATGFHALYTLIERSGGSVALSADPDDRPEGLLILIPNLNTRPEELARALTGHEGPVLIVLPKWVAMPQQKRPTHEERVAMVSPERLVNLLRRVHKISAERVEKGDALSYPSGLALRPFAVPESLQAIRGERLTTLIEAPGGGAVLAEVSNNLFILADPDLINNHGLADRRNARAAIALLAALDPDTPGEVTFDTMLPYGAGGRNIVQLMFEPPFAGVTLALLVAALLAGIAAFARFGPVRREPRAVPFGKGALIENIVTLARRAGRTRDGGAAYADAVRDWAARRLALPRTLQGDALDDQLSALRTDTPYAQWTAKARGARTETDLLHAAQKLDDWRKEVKA